jgi:hypothetical protein
VAAWTVGLLTTVLGESLDQHPEWPLVQHEDLCTDPQTKFREVYTATGLTWGEAADRYLVESNRPGEGLRPVRVTSDQPDKWKQRLGPAEVTMVEETLAQFPSRGWVRHPGRAPTSEAGTGTGAAASG